jgi:protein phosphatase
MSDEKVEEQEQMQVQVPEAPAVAAEDAPTQVPDVGLVPGAVRSRFDCVEHVCLTHPGLVRDNNEDALLAMPSDGGYAVADGMGGGEAGEIASRYVVHALRRLLKDSETESPGERKYRVLQGAKEANKAICQHAEEHRYQTMGSTLVCFLLDPWKSDRAWVSHVGDSRAYCFREGELFRLTQDHTVGAELKGGTENSALGHVLTRALGTASSHELEWSELALCPGDLFLICSDGLYGMLSDEAMEKLFKEDGQGELSLLADLLLQRALDGGGKDNITLILLRVKKEMPPDAETLDPLDIEESDHLSEMAERECTP